MSKHSEAVSKRNRHGRGAKPVLRTTKIGGTSFRHQNFEKKAMAFFGLLYLRNPELLEGIDLTVSELPEHKNSVDLRWKIDRENKSITLYRITIERFRQSFDYKIPFPLHMAELAVLLAVAELLDCDPWNLFNYANNL